MYLSCSTGVDPWIVYHRESLQVIKIKRVALDTVNILNNNNYIEMSHNIMKIIACLKIINMNIICHCEINNIIMFKASFKI